MRPATTHPRLFHVAVPGFVQSRSFRCIWLLEDLGGGDYLLASGFSVADTMCGWSLFTFHGWGTMDLAAGSSPLTLAYLDRLRERPAFRRAEAYSQTEPGLYGRGCVRLN